MNRRTFCRLGIVSLSIAATTNSYAALSLSPEEARKYFGHRIYERSSDDVLDRAIIFELKNITRVLKINPGFKYIDDNNAFATWHTIIDGTRGTVCLGLALIRQLMQEPDGGVSVAGVCAHECAHVHQYDTGLFEELKGEFKTNSVLAELHADFISGYYLGQRSGATEQHLRSFASTIFKFGDYSYNDPAFHGTPGQRAASIEKGYKVGQDKKDIKAASNIGLAYISNL